MEQRANQREQTDKVVDHAKRDRHDQVIISVYNVVDQSDVRRFIATNDRYIERIGGLEALEDRLRNQFRAFELIGTCPVNVRDAGDQINIDETAGAAIFEKIRAIALEHPNCDPRPQPWSEGEYRPDIARSIAESLVCTSEFERRIISDLLQIKASTTDITVVIALVQHKAAVRAAVVLQDAAQAGLRFNDGGESAPVSMTVVPDLDQNASGWVAIPANRLQVADIGAGVTEPVAYLVIRTDGSAGLALAPQKPSGRIGWSGNGELITEITKLLADIGLLIEPRAK